MAYIEWKNEYNTKISVIDGQHKNLVEIINQIADAQNKKEEALVLRESIFKLVEYTKIHFAFEEKHMGEHNFNLLSDHKEEHNKLVEKIVSVLQHIHKNDIKVITNDLLKFLEDWLMSHILVHDKKYSNYYRLNINKF